MFKYGGGIQECGNYCNFATHKYSKSTPNKSDSKIGDKSQYTGGGEPYKATKTISTYDGRNMQPDSFVQKVRPGV